MSNKYRKSTNLHCSTRSRRSLLIALCSVIGCLILLHIFSLLPRKDSLSLNTQLRITQHLRKLEEADDESIQIPPPRKRSPRAVKRKPKKEKVNIIDEFLDESSQLRHVFFPELNTAIDPNKGNDSFDYHPGRIWLDTDGYPIQAHGGGILFDEISKIYYWYGEYKDGPTYQVYENGAARVDIIGVGCYSSTNLWTWKNEGIVLSSEETNETHDLHTSNVLERPKVLYNRKTRKYVMWMHIDNANYTKARVGIATSDYPNGPFNYLYSKNPHNFDSRDMTVFKDDDDVAYLIYSSVINSELHVGPLTDDYLDVRDVIRPLLVGHMREAPAVFKHKGTYYMITSGCTGWAPNRAQAHASESMMGPWEILGNPCIGGGEMFRKTTFFSQGTFVLPLQGLPGYFVFMADRWNPADLRDSRYVWLPMRVAGPADQPLGYDFGFPMWDRVSIYWHKKWRLPYRWSG